MAKFKLVPGEHEVLETESVMNRNTSSIITLPGKFLLTNKRLVWFEKSLLGTPKNFQEYPLDGVRHVSASKRSGSEPELMIGYDTYSLSFEFAEKETAENWAITIRSMLAQRQRMQQGGAKSQQDKAQHAPAQKVVAVSCAYCGAPINGLAGRLARCRYCDSEQVVDA